MPITSGSYMINFISLILLLTISINTFAQASNKPFTILHYNIKELDSQKVQSTLNENSPLNFVKKVINKVPFDILSLNEIQYDLPNVPNPKFQSKGTNLKRIKKILNLTSFQTSFYPANTGLNAKKKEDGTYASSPTDSEARKLADPVNFGIFPAQYSTGAIFKFQKIGEKIINKLTWKTFNPKRDLSTFKDGNGNPLPKSMPLFDKNFSDITLLIDNKIVHLILLHTVPAFHFGNPATPNYIRNADQLRFLEWYTTGATDTDTTHLKSIRTLKSNERFIIVGDLNTDITSDNPGANVLRNLIKKTNLWTKFPKFTNESSGFAPPSLQLLLDYILVSKGIEVIAGGTIASSPNRLELGCTKPSSANINQLPEKVIVSYQGKNGTKCEVSVNRTYYEAKKASDHFPIWASLKIIEME